MSLILPLLCSCAWASSPGGFPPKDAAEAFARADAVFLGEVERVKKDIYGYDSTAYVKVEKVWKGRSLLSPAVVVDGVGGPTYPARIFKVGETYLFYLSASDKGAALRADGFLNRVLPKGEAAGDLGYLARARK
ncbi:MAG TPA: hypothetical protein VFF72_01300 [Caldimonas sp.]|nr:hypothetical protein [Caldimonas sp.]